ncbi:hypothetical protein V8F33_001397 [Rhypophila sp. PSN 637]
MAFSGSRWILLAPSPLRTPWTTNTNGDSRLSAYAYGGASMMTLSLSNRNSICRTNPSLPDFAWLIACFWHHPIGPFPTFRKGCSRWSVLRGLGQASGIVCLSATLGHRHLGSSSAAAASHYYFSLACLERGSAQGWASRSTNRVVMSYPLELVMLGPGGGSKKYKKGLLDGHGRVSFFLLFLFFFSFFSSVFSPPPPQTDRQLCFDSPASQTCSYHITFDKSVNSTSILPT